MRIPSFRFLSVLFLLVLLPVLSVRAANEPVRTAGSRHVTGPRLARLLAEPGIRAQRVGILAVDAGTGEVLAAVHPDRPLVPASTVKLVTLACALHRLGPSRRLETVFLARSRPGADGLLRGNLWIRGGGNPLLRAEDLWAALRELWALGVSRIEGDVVLDDRLFEPPGRPRSWPRRRVVDPYDAPQGAFSIAWDSVEVIVRPGPRPGAPAATRLFPLAHPCRVIARVRTGPPGGKPRVRVRLWEEGAGVLVLSGTIPAGAAPWRRWVHLGHPGEVAAAAVRELLERAEIALGGRVRRGGVPEGADLVELLVHESPPLADLAGAIAKHSSNYGAEMLTRLLAVEAGGVRPGTTDAGVAVLRACLDELAVPRRGVRLVDGSGFGRENRLTPRALVTLLRAAGEHPSWGPELLVALPRAGEDGSLRDRLAAWRGRVRAKTGTLRGVAALAGQADLPGPGRGGGRTILFAVLVNREDGAPPVGAAVVDRLVDALLRDAHPSP